MIFQECKEQTQYTKHNNLHFGFLDIQTVRIQVNYFLIFFYYRMRVLKNSEEQSNIGQ